MKRPSEEANPVPAVLLPNNQKLNLSDSNPVPADLLPNNLKFNPSHSTGGKTSKVIPIRDPYISKLLQRSPESIMAQLSEMAEVLSVKFRFKVDQYSTAFELLVDNPDLSANMDLVGEQFTNLIEELKHKVNASQVNCSLEEKESLMKYVAKGRLAVDGDITYASDLNHKPLILKEFIINECYSVEVVLVENLETMSLEPSDNLVVNMTINGIFLDDFIQKQQISKKIAKYFKKNHVNKPKTDVVEVKLPEFKVFLQVFDPQDLLDDDKRLAMAQKYVSRIFDGILINQQYVNLYYPLPVDREKEHLKLFLTELLEVSKNYPEEGNFLLFPSKISFVCIEKQKDAVIELFEKFKVSGSLNELPAELRHGGKWAIKASHDDFDFGPVGGLFGGVQPNLGRNDKGKVLNCKLSKIIEKSYVLGKKTGFLLIDERKINEKMANLNQRQKYLNYSKKKGESKSKESKVNLYNNADTLEIDLSKMVEVSEITGYEKPLYFHEDSQEYQFLEIISGTFQSYHPQLNKVLKFLKEIKIKKLTYHADFDTMLPIEKLYSFDLTTYQLRLEDNSPIAYPNNQNIPIAYPNNQPFIPGGQPANSFNLRRIQDEKLDPLHLKYLKLSKKVGGELTVKDSSSLEIERPSFKTPYMLIRSMQDGGKFLDHIKSILRRKVVTHLMKMKQTSKLLQKSLEDLCIRNNVQWDLKKNILSLTGNRKTINRLRPEIEKMDEMDLEDAIFPESWDPQSDNLKEVELQIQSKEFGEVAAAFNKTINFKVLKVTRIQNKKLWENYIFEKKRLKFKGNCTEKMLFHGTRNNDPRKIYSGIEEGFDVRLANQGMVGKGIYFAEQASYSASGYGYMKSNGNFQLFYVNVLVGASFESNGGGNFIMPPIMPNNSNMRYDSVRTGTNYTVYNSNRAYAHYLIEYKADGKGLRGLGFAAPALPLFNKQPAPLFNNQPAPLFGIQAAQGGISPSEDSDYEKDYSDNDDD